MTTTQKQFQVDFVAGEGNETVDGDSYTLEDGWIMIFNDNSFVAAYPAGRVARIAAVPQVKDEPGDRNGHPSCAEEKGGIFCNSNQPTVIYAASGDKVAAEILYTFSKGGFKP